MFSRDCAEFIKALGSFDYACANKHVMRISKTHPSIGSICSRVAHCENLYSSMQFLKPKMFRREDHLYQVYGEIASDVDREMSTFKDMAVKSRTFGMALGAAESSRASSIQHGGSDHGSHTTDVSESGHTRSTSAGARASDYIPNSLSPTHHHLLFPHQTFLGRENQTCAEQIALCTILRGLCSLRKALTSIYRLLSTSTVELDVELIVPKVEQALNLYEARAEGLHGTVLGTGILCELRALRFGLLMERAIYEYDIQKSATFLHRAKVSLSEWRQLSSEQEYAEKSQHRPEETTWRYNIFSSGEDKNKPTVRGKSNLQPNHLQWLSRWIASEKTKMTIYFMVILLEKEQVVGGDERSLWTNIEPDIHGMIRTFRKKAGAHSISFVYEISPTVPFSVSGFVSANAPYESPTGLNSFPCIYSYPSDPPRDHWPNIISIMQGSLSILQQFRSQYFYDRKIGCTYYVARVDQHVSIVIIYLDKHPQPDSGAMDFLQLLAGKLRHTDVLLALRTE